MNLKTCRDMAVIDRVWFCQFQWTFPLFEFAWQFGMYVTLFRFIDFVLPLYKLRFGDYIERIFSIAFVIIKPTDIVLSASYYFFFYQISSCKRKFTKVMGFLYLERHKAALSYYHTIIHTNFPHLACFFFL